MVCPSRRRTNVYPLKPPLLVYRYCSPLEVSGRTDYAANGGSVQTTEIGDGPPETGEDLLAIRPSNGPDMLTAKGDPKSNWNGIVFYLSEINMRQVTDGTSKTYMVGEKWMYYENYETGQDPGDGEPAFSGNNDDTIRVTNRNWPFGPDTQYTPDPTNSTASLERRAFGSAHNGGFNMAMCDGSVDLVSFDIDKDVHAWRGARNDGDEKPPEIFR